MSSSEEHLKKTLAGVLVLWKLSSKRGLSSNEEHFKETLVRMLLLWGFLFPSKELNKVVICLVLWSVLASDPKIDSVRNESSGKRI